MISTALEVKDLSNIHILIADDESRIRDMIREYVSSENYFIDEAGDGDEALDKFNGGQYDLVILDVMMPKVDGWSVCRQIRRNSNVPIIMLTARGEEYDRLFGFELGVDDYIVKPFSPKELLARMKAIIRRSAPDTASPRPRLVFEGIEVDTAAHNVYVDGDLKSLTPREYELFTFLAQNPGMVFSRDQLLSSVWGYDYFGDDRTVDTHIKMLRDTLGRYREYIVTVWGTGYKFEPGGMK
jgi:DNA-binding response OmpR family regulator